MTLVGILTEIEKNGKEEISKLDGNRPLIVDGSISEILTRALNIAYAKKNKMSDNPEYGLRNDDVKNPPGAFGSDNEIDIENQYAIKPDMEGFQEKEAQIRLAAAKLSNAIDARNNDGLINTRAKPILIYAVPENLMVDDRTKEELDAYLAAGVKPKDFVFTYIEDVDVNMNLNKRSVDISDHVVEMEKNGARVYHSLREFLDRISDQ